VTVLRPSRRPAGPRLAAAALAVCALSGCSLMSPQTTQNVTYAPSDGVQGELGEVKVRNVMVLTAEQGAPAEVVGSLFNGSGDDVEVEVVVREPSDDPAAPNDPLTTSTLQLDGNQSLSIGPQADEQVEIDGLDVVIGTFAEITFIGGGGSLVLQAPVLDGTLPEYAELLEDEG
jgi:hypothetical protein